MTLATKCRYLVLQAGGNPLGFEIFADTPDEITSWDEAACNRPEPTTKELADCEMPMQREAKIGELWAWYEAKTDAGIDVDTHGEQHKLKAKQDDVYSIASSAFAESLDVSDPDTPTTDETSTLFFDYSGMPKRVSIGKMKKIAIAYKEVLKGWNDTFATKLEEIVLSDDPDSITIPE